VEAHGTLQPIEINACAPCSLFWFDKWESVRLTPEAVIGLFQFIGQAASAPKPLANAFRCPRCTTALAPIHDLQRTTRFTYWRCPSGRGKWRLQQHRHGMVCSGEGVGHDSSPKRWHRKELPQWSAGFFSLFLNVGLLLFATRVVTAFKGVSSALEFRPLQMLGLMCYSIYVWHGIILKQVGHSTDALFLGSYAVIVLFISFLTYRFVEFGSEGDWRKLLPLRV